MKLLNKPAYKAGKFEREKLIMHQSGMLKHVS